MSVGPASSGEDKELEAELKRASQVVDSILAETAKEIIGQELMRRRLLTALITDGHVLLEGVPGLAKTLSINAIARAIDASFRRIQFTPDLLPADLVGSEIYRAHEGRFEVRKGPVFANLVLADEINRAPAKVQSALLETMQERQVTIGEQTLPVPYPFLVMATQNPIEQEGTYALPEAQIDRFLMKIRVTYPAREDERRMLDVVTMPENQRSRSNRVVTLHDIERVKQLLHKIYVDDRVKQYIMNIVWASRSPKEFGLDLETLIELGASPRAAISLFHVARAEALILGERFVVPQMIKDVAADVLRHRIILTYEAEAQGLTPDDIVEKLLQGIPVP